MALHTVQCHEFECGMSRVQDTPDRLIGPAGVLVSAIGKPCQPHKVPPEYISRRIHMSQRLLSHSRGCLGWWFLPYATQLQILVPQGFTSLDATLKLQLLRSVTVTPATRA